MFYFRLQDQSLFWFKDENSVPTFSIRCSVSFPSERTFGSHSLERGWSYFWHWQFHHQMQGFGYVWFSWLRFVDDLGKKFHITYVNSSSEMVPWVSAIQQGINFDPVQQVTLASLYSFLICRKRVPISQRMEPLLLRIDERLFRYYQIHTLCKLQFLAVQRRMLLR